MRDPIYEPRGAAREYAELALNVYEGCTHQCAYCYAVVSTPFDVVCAMTDTGRVGPDCEGNWDACMYASCKHIVDGRWIYQNGFAIAMLDGWEQSRGARIEHNLAKALGIECRPWMEWL